MGVNTEHPFLFLTFLLLISQLCFKGFLVKSAVCLLFPFSSVYVWYLFTAYLS